jgi:polyisoprenoid-binding protein YceI
MYKHTGIAALALLVTACGVPQPRSPTSQPPGGSGAAMTAGSVGVPTAPPIGAATPTGEGSALPPAGEYRIDPARSELRLLVYRAGPLANLGHNHVMVNRALGGAVSVRRDLADCSITLTVPVGAFVVDDAALRREEGADFAGDVPDEAKLGTLHNMLSAALLNADAHPTLSLRSTAIAAAGGVLRASFAVSIAGHEAAISVPFELKALPHAVSASGSIELRQTGLGLTPYSLMLGALQVQDLMRVKFSIVAVAVARGP